MLAGLTRIADFLGLALASMLILWLYVAPLEGMLGEYLLATIVLPAATVIIIGSFKGYTIGTYRRAIEKICRGVMIWSAVFASFALVLFFLKMGEEFSRVWLASWFVSGIAVLTALRLIAGGMVARWKAAGVLERRAVLVGGGPEAVELIRALRVEPANDIRICGIFDDREDARVPALAEGLPKLGRIDELLEFGRQAEIDMLIVAHADECRAAPRRAAPQALGAAGRHPPFRARQQAAVPPALLFLCRRGALPRPLRPADRRLGQRRESLLRPRRRRPVFWC